MDYDQTFNRINNLKWGLLHSPVMPSYRKGNRKRRLPVVDDTIDYTGWGLENLEHKGGDWMDNSDRTDDQHTQISMPYPKPGIIFKSFPKVILAKRGKFEKIIMIHVRDNPYSVDSRAFKNLTDAMIYVERDLIPRYVEEDVRPVQSEEDEFNAYNTWSGWTFPNTQWVGIFKEYLNFEK